jgi:hypothetical protein
MKTLKKYIFGLALALILFSYTSCKKEFLEIIPKESQIAINTKDYELMLNANYLLASNGGAFMGDEIAALDPHFQSLSIRKQRLFKFEDRIYEIDELPAELNGSETYINRLYLFNKIINEVMDSKKGTDAQKRAILAEAKAGRAICNFMFLTDFSTPYNATTAATDLGIPNLTEADVTLKDFSRLTQKENYELIIKDFDEAMPDLGVLAHRRKISKLAAKFYLARVYMAMNNYTAAKPVLDEAFLELPKSTIPLALYNYNVVLDPNAVGTWFPVLFGAVFSGIPNAAANTEYIYDISAGVAEYTGPAANAFVISPQTIALFDPLDKRPNLFDNTEFSGSAVFPLGMKRPLGFFAPVGPSLSDLYLMRAECRARANELPGAVADIELVRVKRSGTPSVPAAIAGNQQALVRYVLDERIREFTFTGMRWLDMRRLSNDPIYSSHVKYTHELRNATTGAVTSTYTLRPQRFALKFGERMLRESNGLQENQ